MTHVSLDIDVTSDTAVPTAAQSGLSPRQQQILALLKAGKVNKEIANELGIGLGTVKQHVVALFKKLNVSNRTMAVSHGQHLPSSAQAEPSSLTDSVLERRPCVVLSICLPLSSAAAPVQALFKTFAGLAIRHQALFLARQEHAAGDLIFGVQRITEQDIFRALAAARSIYAALTDFPGQAGLLQGGLTAGLAIVSMHRRGGWTGEAVAGAVIAKARLLASSANPGTLSLGTPAGALLDALSPNAPGFSPAALPLNALERMPWGKGAGSEIPLIGRGSELASLEALLADSRNAANAPRTRQAENYLVYIEGETGMGKSRLCRHLAERNTAAGGHSHHFVCQSDSEKDGLYLSPSGAPVTWSAMLHCLKAVTGRVHKLVIVDDCHLLPAPALAKLAALAARGKGKLVLLTARKFAASLPEPCRHFKLGRMARDDINKLVALALESNTDAINAAAGIEHDSPAQHAPVPFTDHITACAAGVPLFAMELARRAPEEALPLSLRVVIGARMDGLPLDRAVLHQAAKAARSVAEIAEALQEAPESIRAAVEQAIAAGVLQRDADGHLCFVHPLLRQVIDQSQVE